MVLIAVTAAAVEAYTIRMRKRSLISKVSAFFCESADQEWPVSLRFRIGWMAFMVLATSAPYIVNWLQTPPGYYYTWWLPYDAQDQFAYMAWANQAGHGALLFKIKYTALAQTPFLFHPFFLICGWLSALFHADLGFTFFAVKAVGVVVFFVSFYRYLDFLRLGRTAFITASVLVGISAGFAQVFGLFGMDPKSSIFPADLDWPEMSTYWSLLLNPLFPFSLTLMILTIYWADKGTQSQRPACFWASGAATGLEALIHPYPVPLLLAWVTFVTAWRIRGRAMPYLARYFAAALPSGAYLFLIAKTVPVVAGHSARGQMESSNLIAYLSGFGLPLIISVIGYVVNPAKLKQYWQIAAWFIVAIAFAYLPIWFQRKLIFGSHVPLCILAGIGFEAICAKCVTSRVGRVVMAGTALFLLPVASATSLRVFAVQLEADPKNPQNGSFIPSALMEGFRFLKKHSDPDELVFADYITSRYLPAYSGNTVIWGHWAMSVDANERQEWVTNIFDPASGWDDSRRVREFYGSRIEFIFLDEQLLLRLQQQPTTMQLILDKSEKIFENSAVSIYRSSDRQPGY